LAGIEGGPHGGLESGLALKIERFSLAPVSESREWVLFLPYSPPFPTSRTQRNPWMGLRFSGKLLFRFAARW
jgi:hypothetical protein